jgi:hypothetical protein
LFFENIILDVDMNQLSSKDDVNNCNDDSTESGRLSPPRKRHCQTSNSTICLPNPASCVLVDLTPDDIEENREECKSCGKQETLLRTFNCPSLHYFCLNCIFNWTQKHVQVTKFCLFKIIEFSFFIFRQKHHRYV